ncbi:hypothetical protein GCM10022403_046390 [Streptomyces coacervatus]|uniref:Transposase n=1 Tax=Streptomyces coacervatus TaxID=647381 RepID=A0ABP7I1Y8_9ACTN
MTKALGEHGPVLHGHDGHEQERQQAQDLPEHAGRDASGESSWGEWPLGKVYRSHISRGFPARANGGLRKWGQGLKRGQRLAYGHRVLRGGRQENIDLNVA